MKKILILLILILGCIKNSKNLKNEMKGFNEELLEAVIKNDQEKVKLLIQRGANVNFKNERGDTLLLISAKNGNTELMKILIEAGANLNFKDIDGNSVLICLLKGIANKSNQKSNLDKLINSSNNNNFFTNILKAGVSLLLENKTNSVSSDSNDIEMIKYLVRAGIVMNEKDHNGTNTFILAVSTFNLEIINFWLNNSVDINLSDSYNRTALMIASLNGKREIAALLISKGANVNLIDKDMNTALLLAINSREKDLIKLLLDSSADVNHVNRDGDTALTKAVKANIFEIVELLIKRGAKVNQKIGIVFSGKKSILMLAIENKSIDIAKILIASGADINYVDNSENTALIKAVEAIIFEISEILIKKGADVNQEIRTGFLGFSGKMSLLMFAIENKNIDIAKLLIESGADINYRFWKSTLSGREDKTILRQALCWGNNEVLGLLIEKGVKYDKENIDPSTILFKSLTGVPHVNKEKEKNTFKHHILQVLLKNVQEGKSEKSINIVNTYFNKTGSNTEILGVPEINLILSATLSQNKVDENFIVYLIEKGANINYKGLNGNAALLIIAAEEGFIKIVEKLLNEGANINIRSNEEKTAFIYAAENNNRDIMKILIEKSLQIGISVNLDNIIEKTIIGNIQNSQIESFFLIEDTYKNIVNFKYKDREGNTFLHHLAPLNDIRLFSLFLDKEGIDVNELNNRGETPLYCALSKSNFNEDFIFYLLDKEASLQPSLCITDNLLLDISSRNRDLHDKLVQELLITKIVGNIRLKHEDRISLITLIKLINLEDSFFINQLKMLEYIRNIYKIKYRKINVSVNEIENLEISDDNIDDIVLDIDFLVGTIFDLESRNEYYGDTNLDSLKKNFKSRLKSIARVSTPNSIPSINASDEDKTNYIKYLTKRKLKDLGKFLTNLNTHEREQKLVGIMNYLLINLSCHVGTLEAVTNAYNSLLNNDVDEELEELIGRELMLYRIKLIEEIGRNHFNNSDKCKLISKVGNIKIENIAEYNEHMKAYLVMDLKEELKVTGLYEKDFEYKYDKQFIINEVKRLYKERSLEYIIEVIIRSRTLQNKILEYIQSAIFKDKVSDDKEQPTVLHIENFINDEDLNISKEAIISLLIHFNFFR